MAKPKGIPTPSYPTGPKKPKKPRGYRVALGLALFMLGMPACGDGEGPAKDTLAICTGLAGSVAEHLYELACDVSDIDLLVDLGTACYLGDPTVQEAIDCYDDVLSLDACPDQLPASCLSFIAHLEGDEFWTTIEAAPYRMGGTAGFGDGSTEPGDTDVAARRGPIDRVIDFVWPRDAALSACLNRGQPCYNPNTGRGGTCCGQLQCLSGIPGTVVSYCCGCIEGGQCKPVSQCP